MSSEQKAASWTVLLRQRKLTIQLNERLADSLAHCLPLEAGGWRFLCTECHVATGTYPTGFSRNWHSHNEYQIEVAVSGEFEFFAASSKKLVIKPGQALVIPWKLAHRWKCVSSGVMIGIALQLEPTLDSVQNDGWLINSAQLVQSPRIREQTGTLLASAKDSAHPAFQSRITSSHLFLLLAEIMEAVIPLKNCSRPSGGMIAAETRGREAVRWMLRYLEEHLDTRIDLDRICREAGISSRQMNRLFLKHVGKSLHDHLLERRLEHARTMLATQGDKLQVKEIAFACGFNSLAYFSNTFRKVYGLSPSSFLLAEVKLKSRSTLLHHQSPGEAPGPSPRKRALDSAKSSARG